MVIGFGGGSALDAGKAIAGLAANGCDPFEYLEVVGKGKPLTRPSLPYIAIPTTAGTGTEVTRNAVLAAPEHRQKVSLRSPFLLPRLALVDPELTYTLPPLGHRQHRPGCADAIDRALRLQSGQSHHRRALQGRDAACGAIPAPGDPSGG